MKRPCIAGFTIIELMVATAAFSVILTIVAAAIVGIDSTYTHGMIASETQDVSRTIEQNVAQAIQFTPGTITLSPSAGLTNSYQTASKVSALCVDSQLYTFQLGKLVSSTQHGLMFSNVNNCATYIGSGSPTYSNWTTPGGTGTKEMLNAKMRLADLTVTQVNVATGMYSVNVRVVYGDPDLLCSSAATGTDPASCASTTAMTEAQVNAMSVAQLRQLRCKDVHAGGQFCAMAESSTMVTRRI